MGRGARRQQDHPKSEVKSPDSPVISGEEQVAPRCGQRNPSSSATKGMNQQAPGVVRPNSTRMHNENILGSEPFANEPIHNMPLRQLSARGLTLETGLAREFGSLLSAALRSAPPKAATIRTGWPLLHRRHRPQMPLSRPSASAPRPSIASGEPVPVGGLSGHRGRARPDSSVD